MHGLEGSAPFRRPRLYQQLAEHLSDFIEAQGLVPGDKLPPERALAAQLGVSRATLSRALVALEVQGLVDIRHGDGVVVQEPPAATTHAVRSLQSGIVVAAVRKLAEGEDVPESPAELWVMICRVADEPATCQMLEQLEPEPPSLTFEQWGELRRALVARCEKDTLAVLWEAWPGGASSSAE